MQGLLRAVGVTVWEHAGLPEPPLTPNRQQLETEKKRRETVEREKEQMMREKEELMLRLQDFEQKTKKAEKGAPVHYRHSLQGLFSVDLDIRLHQEGQTDSQYTHTQPGRKSPKNVSQFSAIPEIETRRGADSRYLTRRHFGALV